MIYFQKLKSAKKNQGMTYVELIVVLGIFAVMSSVAIFNYGGFQARVDIRNLSNDVAIKIIEAQKSALAGKFPVSTSQQTVVSDDLTWKPTYGVYFDLISSNKSFIYFIELDNEEVDPDNFKTYAGSTPGGGNCVGECVENINITKGNYISEIKIFYYGGSTSVDPEIRLSFTRPDSAVMIVNNQGSIVPNVEYVQITVTSPKDESAYVKVYSSGRIQIN